MAVTKLNVKQIDAFGTSTSSKIEANRTLDMNSNVLEGVSHLTASQALVTNDMVIQGNLTVAGDQLIANVSILEVEDLSIRAAKNAANSTAANGAGLQIGLSGTYEQSILWSHAQQRWNVSSALSASSLHGPLSGEAGQLAAHDSDDLAEGSVNLYYQNERVDDRVAALIVGGSGVISTYDDAAGSLTLDFDIDELSALGGTGVAQGDHFVFSDAGTEKKITFSNLEDAIFGNVSGDATVAAGGGMTIANDAITSAKIATGAVIADGIGAAAVEHGALNDNIISGQAELAHADILDADEMMISDGGVIKRVGVDSLRDHYFGVVSGDATIADGGALTIAAGAVQDSMVNDDVATGLAGAGLSAASGIMALDLNELGAATVNVAADSIAIVDADDNTSKKESIVDLVAGMAGPGLSAASGQLSIAAVAGGVIDPAADSFRFTDADDSNITKSESLADYATAIAGAGLAASGGVLSFDLDEFAELAAAPHATEDEFVVSDDGTEKRVSMTNVANGAFALVSGDATIASGGALTIAANAVQDSMVNDDVAAGLAGVGLSAASGVMAVDFNELPSLAQADMELDEDFFAVMEADGTLSKKASMADYATSVAGAGLAAASGVLSLDIDELGALGSAAVAQGDHFVFSDAGTEKKITFSNMEDAIFGNVSGDATIAAGGALTIGATKVLHSMLNNDVAQTLAGTGLSNPSAGVMAVDLDELADAGISVNVDSIAFIDNTDNSTKKERVSDLVAAMAGAGLSASAGQLSIAAVAGGTIDVAADSFNFTDANDSNITKSESLADYATAIAGAGVLATSGVLSVPAKKQKFEDSDFSGLNCTLSSAPQVAQSVQVFLNGQLLTEASDWSISGTTLTLADAALTLDTDDVLMVHWI